MGWARALISPQCSHNHNPEILACRTSTLSTEVLGFDGVGKVVNYQADGSGVTTAQVSLRLGRLGSHGC